MKRKKTVRGGGIKGGLVLVGVVVVAGLLIRWYGRGPGPITSEPVFESWAEVSERGHYGKPDDEELQERLSPMQYVVTQRDGTEPAFANQFWNYHGKGIYVDIVSGEPLFSSADKFDSGTGWPSFSKPIDPEFVVEREDYALGIKRVEIRSKLADSHLGHVFEDGPPALGGLRYCMNSAALRFVPVEEMVEQGYGDLVGTVE